MRGRGRGLLAVGAEFRDDPPAGCAVPDSASPAPPRAAHACRMGYACLRSSVCGRVTHRKGTSRHASLNRAARARQRCCCLPLLLLPLLPAATRARASSRLPASLHFIPCPRRALVMLCLTVHTLSLMSLTHAPPLVHSLNLSFPSPSLLFMHRATPQTPTPRRPTSNK